jgi:hypothetical protein
MHTCYGRAAVSGGQGVPWKQPEKALRRLFSSEFLYLPESFARLSHQELYWQSLARISQTRRDPINRDCDHFPKGFSLCAFRI